MKHLGWVLVGLLAPSIALAANAYQVAKRAEASMVVTGSIIVNPDGSVNSYTLDKQDKLPSAVVEVIGKTVPTWKFQPITVFDLNNKPALAKAIMSLRVVARPLGDSKYALGVSGVSFGKGSDGADSGKGLTYKDHKPPHYPRAAIEERVSGIVYLLIRVGRDGRVSNVAAEQVDLRTAGDDTHMEEWRWELIRPAISAAKGWTFNFPQGIKADHLTVRAPVVFEIVGGGLPSENKYGQWDAYVPGPVNRIPWADSEQPTAHGAADAIPNDGIVFQDDGRFVLLNAPGKG